MQPKKDPKAKTAEAKPKAPVEATVSTPVAEPPKVEPTPAPTPVAPPAIDKTELALVEPAKIENNQLQLTDKHLELIKTQIAPTATHGELELFIMMARRTRLDPLMKQLYFIKYGQGDRAKVSYVTSIDGYRIIAHRTNDFAGIDEPKFERDPKTGQLSRCSVTVYKLVQGVRCGFSATVKFSEYNTNLNNWTKMPETMIAKVAEAHALRKAFPNDLSGIYTQDEMDQAENARQIPPKLMTKPQMIEIQSLMARKGFSVDDLKSHVSTHYKVNTMARITSAQADEIIATLKKEKDKDDFMQPPTETSQEVNLDDIPDDLGQTKKDDIDPVEAINTAADAAADEPLASAGEIAMFLSLVKRHADLKKKDDTDLLFKFLAAIKVETPDHIPQKIIRRMNDLLTKQNAELGDSLAKEEKAKRETNELVKTAEELFDTKEK